MLPNSHDHYLESEVMGADPVKLVSLLYRGALDSVGAARRHLAAGDIAQRSRQIQKAWDILHQLLHSLDTNHQISFRLAALYAYMQGRLLDANSQQIDEPLAEVERLLIPLAEAWQSLQTTTAASTPPSSYESYQPVSCSC